MVADTGKGVLLLLLVQFSVLQCFDLDQYVGKGKLVSSKNYKSLETFKKEYSLHEEDIIGEGPVAVAGEGQSTDYYTVKAAFVPLINHIRESSEEFKLEVKPEGNELFTITMRSNGKGREYRHFPKKILNLFIKLVKNPNLQVKVVEQLGPNVKIAVEPEPPKPTNIIQVKPIFLDLVKKIREQGGVSLKILTTPENKYNFIITDENGQEQRSPDIEPDIGRAFIRLVKDPELEFQVLGKTDEKISLFIPNFSGSQNTFDVDPLFLQILRQIRSNPDNKIQIETGHDGKYILIVNDGKESHKYEHIEPDLLYTLVKLIRDPSLQFKVSPGPEGKLRITVQNKPAAPNVEEISDEELLEKVKCVRGDPSYKVTIEPGEDGLELVINHGNERNRYPLEPRLINTVVKLISQSKAAKEKKSKSGTAIILNDRPSKNHQISVKRDLVAAIEDIKSHPERHYNVQLQPEDDGQYTAVIDHDGNPKTIKDVPPEALKLLLKMAKNPNSPHHVVVDDPSKPNDLSLIVPEDNTEAETQSIPAEQVELIQTVKASPQLVLNVEPDPDDDDYTVTLTDGNEVKTYPKIKPEFLRKLVDIRNQANLPLEIKPGKPGQVDVLVPKADDPDVEETEAPIELIKNIQKIRKDPKLQMDILPDDQGTFNVRLKDDKKEESIEHVTPEILQRLVDLKTNPDPTFSIKSGKPGKVVLVTPKTQDDPVRVGYSPEIIKLLRDVKRKPSPKISLKPGNPDKPGTYTMEVDDKPYKDLPAELIPIVTKMASQPNVEYEIKPGKNNTVQFVPPEPSADVDRYNVDPEALEMVSRIKKNPSKPLQVRPGKPGKYTVEIPDEEDKPHTYPDLDPETLKLLMNLKSHPDLPFSLKPNPDGSTNVLVPKSDVTEEEIPIRPLTLVLLNTLKKNPNLDLQVQPEADNSVTVTLSDGDKKKQFPKIPLKALPLIYNVYSDPEVDLHLKPTDDGQILAGVPKDQPTTTTFPLSVDDIELIHNSRRDPRTKLRINRNPDDSVDVTVAPGPNQTEYYDVSPKVANLVTKLVTQPKLPYHILTGKNGENVLVLPERPREKIYKDVPKEVIDLVEKYRNAPGISVDIEPGKLPETYSIDISDNGKPLKKIPDVNPDVAQLVGLLMTQTQVEYRKQVTEDDKLTIIPSTEDVPTIDVDLEPEQLQTIRNIERPEVSKVDVVPTEDKKYSIVLHDGVKPQAITNIRPLFLNFLVRLYSEPKLPYKVYVGDEGGFVASIPKRVSKNVFENVDQQLVEFIKEIQPKSRDTTFTITPNPEKPNNFNLDVKTKDTKRTFSNLTSSTVQLFTVLTSQPELHPRILNIRDGKSTVYVTSHLPYTIFRNVKPNFLHLAEAIRRDPEMSVNIDRRPNNQIDMEITDNRDGLNIYNVNPDIGQLFISLFSKEDFPYNYYLDAKDTVTLVIKKDVLTPTFPDIKPKFLDLLKKIRLPQNVHVTLQKEDDLYNSEVTINKERPLLLENLKPQDIQLLTLFMTHIDLRFHEQPQPDGKFTVKVIIPSRSPVFDFAQMAAGTKVVESTRPLPEPLFEPEEEYVPVRRPELGPEPSRRRGRIPPRRPSRRPSRRPRGNFGSIARSYKRVPVEEGPSFDDEINARRNWFPGYVDDRLLEDNFEDKPGSRDYYRNKRQGRYGSRKPCACAAEERMRRRRY